MSAHPGDALSGYLDGELPPEQSRALEAHLEGCPSCREELADVDEARRLLRRLPPRTPRGPLIDLVRPRRRQLWWAGAAVAAAVGAFFIPLDDSRVAPSLPTLVDSHATRASLEGDPLSQLAPIAVPAVFAP